MHSHDFSRALVSLTLTSKKIVGKRFNICSDKILTWEKIFLIYFNLLKIKPSFILINKNNLKNNEIFSNNPHI